ncbi:MAG: GNAT family N-acetyltransferase, partial [Burkholderiales bacterium]
MQSQTAPRWEETSYQLVYRIGDLTLFSYSFSALSLKDHFLALPPDPEIPPPPIGRLNDGMRVIVTRSHPVRETLPTLSRIKGAIRYVPSQYLRRYADLTGTFQDYLAKFSAKTRNTLRRKVKTFLSQGAGSEMRAFKRPEDMPEFYRMARAVSSRTYQERLLDAGLPQGEEFQEALIADARRGAARGYLLFLRNEPIAYLYCPSEDGVLIYSHLGYDQAHAALSPGTVLQFLAFEALFEERAFRAFDFTEGDAPHKKLFGTHEIRCADICYFASGLGSLFWVVIHRGTDRISAFAGRALESMRLKTFVKRLL